MCILNDFFFQGFHKHFLTDLFKETNALIWLVNLRLI